MKIFLSDLDALTLTRCKSETTGQENRNYNRVVSPIWTRHQDQIQKFKSPKQVIKFLKTFMSLDSALKVAKNDIKEC